MKSLIITSVVLIILFIFGISIFANIGNTKNNCVKSEKRIEAIHRNMENIHSNTFKKIAQKANVSKNYTNELKDLVKEYVQGRGNNAKMFSFVKEAMPNLTPELHKDIMNTIEEGNNEFKVAQTEKIEAINQYETYLESGIIRPMVISMLGYPKINLEEYKTVISVNATKKVFETKEDIVQEVF